MLLVTTLDYYELGSFIKNKQVSLDNASLIFGQNYDSIHKYLTERLGSDSYVMGIRGRLNENMVGLLSQLDNDLQGDRVILEVNVDDEDILVFNAQGLTDATEMMVYGLPEDMVFDQLDESVMADGGGPGIQVICTSVIKKVGDIRVTSLKHNINFDVEGITFVKMGNTTTESKT